MAKKKLVKKLWSKNDIKLLRKLFPNKNAKQVAAKLGRSVPAVSHKAERLKLKKTKTYLKAIGRK